MNTKRVDKFQFDQTQAVSNEGIQIIRAQHTLLKSYFTLKKITLKQAETNIQQQPQLRIMNQAQILKEYDGKFAFKCHKMLKTVNNLYLVQDEISGQKFDHKKMTAQSTKTVIEQMITFLIEIKRKNIVMLNLSPYNTGVLHQKAQLTIKILNFQYAHKINKPLNRTLINVMSFNQYVAPQVINGAEKIDFSADVFSLGNILKDFNFDVVHNAVSNSMTSQNLKDCIQKMIDQNPKNRPPIEKVYELFCSSQKSKKKIDKKPSFEPSSSKKFITKENQSTSPCSDSSKKIEINSTLLKSQRILNVNIQGNRRCCQKILKRRSLSKMLLKISFICLETANADRTITAILAFLLLKRSTLIEASLAKFLSTGIIDRQVKINQLQAKKFFKSGDFSDIQGIIVRQMNSHKRFLNQSVQFIELHNKSLLDDKMFAKELRVEKINETYFKKIVCEFLTQVYKSKWEQQKKSLVYLVILSLIFQFDSFQKLFEKYINEEILDFEEQNLFKQLNNYGVEQLEQSIKENLQKMEKK